MNSSSEEKNHRCLTKRYVQRATPTVSKIPKASIEKIKYDEKSKEINDIQEERGVVQAACDRQWLGKKPRRYIGRWIARDDTPILQGNWKNKIIRVNTMIAKQPDVDLKYLLNEALKCDHLHEQINDIIIQQVMSSLFQNIARGRITRDEFTQS